VDKIANHLKLEWEERQDLMCWVAEKDDVLFVKPRTYVLG
jgi:hypothetical protein